MKFVREQVLGSCITLPIFYFGWMLLDRFFA